MESLDNRLNQEFIRSIYNSIILVSFKIPNIGKFRDKYFNFIEEIDGSKDINNMITRSFE